jgi:hypothetical protein
MVYKYSLPIWLLFDWSPFWTGSNPHSLCISAHSGMVAPGHPMAHQPFINLENGLCIIPSVPFPVWVFWPSGSFIVFTWWSPVLHDFHESVTAQYFFDCLTVLLWESFGFLNFFNCNRQVALYKSPIHLLFCFYWIAFFFPLRPFNSLFQQGTFLGKFAVLTGQFWW